MTIYQQDIKNLKKIEIIERPDDPDQFELDMRNSEDGSLRDRDIFNKWAVYYEDNILKICYYPYNIKN